MTDRSPSSARAVVLALLATCVTEAVAAEVNYVDANSRQLICAACLLLVAVAVGTKQLVADAVLGGGGKAAVQSLPAAKAVVHHVAPPTIRAPVVDAAAHVATPSEEAQRLLEAEQRLLEAFGYDASVEEADEISAEDIAAFKAVHRPSGGSLKPIRYKDRSDSEPLCDVISRWQAKEPSGQSSPILCHEGCSPKEVASPKDAPGARHSSKPSAHRRAHAAHKRPKHAAQPARSSVAAKR